MRGSIVFVIGLIWASATFSQQIQRPDILGSILRSELEAERIRAMRAERELLETQRRAIEADTAARMPRQPATDPLIERVNAAIGKRVHLFPDFEEVALNTDLRITHDMLEFISGSVYAADIFYFLGKNPEESAALSVMSKPDMARRVTQIESQLKAATN